MNTGCSFSEQARIDSLETRESFMYTAPAKGAIMNCINFSNVGFIILSICLGMAWGSMSYAVATLPKLILCVKNLRLTSFLLAILFAAQAHAADTSMIDKLKTYRTYYILNSLGHFTHTFDVWFDNDEGIYCQFSANQPSDVSSLGSRSYSCGSGFYGVRPKGKVPVVPKKFTSIEVELKKIILRDYPKAKNFLFSYSGEYRQADLVEVTPLSIGHADERLYASAWFGLKFFRDGHTELTPASGEFGLGRGFGLWCSRETRPCEGQRAFVNYVLPPELEGSSPVDVRTFDKERKFSQYVKIWDELVESIRQTIESFDNGSYSNPIFDILNAQGDTVLPPQFNQYLKFSLSLFFYNEEVGSELRGAQEFSRDVYISTKDILNQGSFNLDIETGNLGAKIHMELKKGKTLAVTVISPSGAKGSKDYAIDVWDKRVIRDGGNVAVAGVSVEGPGNRDDWGRNSIEINSADGEAELNFSWDSSAVTSSAFLGHRSSLAR